MLYLIKCRDKYVYYYDEDYMYGEISLVDIDCYYYGLSYKTRECAEFRLQYIKDNFSSIVNNDIDIFDLMEMEVVEIEL